MAGASKRVRRRPPDRHFQFGPRHPQFGPRTLASRPKARESLKVASHTLQCGFPGRGPAGVRMRLPRRSVGSTCAGVRTVSLLVHSAAPRGGGAERVVEQVIPWFH